MPPKVGKNKIQDKNLAFASAKDAAISNASNLINFSFKYLVSDNDKFPCNCWDSEYYIDLFERIRHLCTMRKLDFTSNVNKTLRNHPIKWETTSEPGFGFPMEDQIVDTPYQFSLSANDKGRVHGFFIANTFYVVWLDRNHALYPQK